MKRRLMLLGPIVALIGSLGLILFRSATVGAFFEVLTFRSDDPPAQPLAALADLRWVVILTMALGLGHLRRESELPHHR